MSRVRIDFRKNAREVEQANSVTCLNKPVAFSVVALEFWRQHPWQTHLEPRPKGGKEGEPIEDYVVENASNSLLHTAKTQKADRMG
jgi:hypothetical protein